MQQSINKKVEFVSKKSIFEIRSAHCLVEFYELKTFATRWLFRQCDCYNSQTGNLITH